MTNNTAPEARQGPYSVEVILDQPIWRGDKTIDVLTIRKPSAGELRGGVQLADLAQLDVNTLIKVLPRICTPQITEMDVAGMDPADITACGVEVAGFLLTKGMRASHGV